jgi:hypothetical protein
MRRLLSLRVRVISYHHMYTFTCSAGSCFFTLLLGRSRSWTSIVRLEASLLCGAGVGGPERAGRSQGGREGRNDLLRL